MRLIGAALKSLREERKISQEAAADALRPALTGQAWGRYENGKLKGILEPTVQRNLLAAIGVSYEAFQFAVARIRREGPEPSRRVSPEFSVREPSAAFQYGQGSREARFPLASGEVVINYPARLDAAGVEELESYLNLFLKAARDRAAN